MNYQIIKIIRLVLFVAGTYFILKYSMSNMYKLFLLIILFIIIDTYYPKIDYN
jgi:hypothetical protein